MTMLPPGSTIGILGGGQLGKMLAIAAAQMGYRCHIYAPEENSVAAEVAAEFTCAAYDDVAALSTFADGCDVITYEFENVPVAPLRVIEAGTPILPNIRALEIAQDRVDEKLFAAKLGGRTARFAEVADQADAPAAFAKIGFPSILKTIRMGYDGKGQARVTCEADIPDALAQIGMQPAIAEAMVQFDAEFSVILARNGDGDIRFWDSPRNRHDGGILALSALPAGALIEAQQEEARKLAAAAAQALDYIGVMTMEFFATAEGPLFNEMAPRVHNSGHWTIEGAVTSQFENHIRAVCDLPLGDTGLSADRIEMENLIGDAANDFEKLFADPNAKIHLYGKGAPSPGRKMGHVTRLYR